MFSPFSPADARSPGDATTDAMDLVTDQLLSELEEFAAGATEYAHGSREERDLQERMDALATMIEANGAGVNVISRLGPVLVALQHCLVGRWRIGQYNEPSQSLLYQTLDVLRHLCASMTPRAVTGLLGTTAPANLTSLLFDPDIEMDIRLCCNEILYPLTQDETLGHAEAPLLEACSSLERHLARAGSYSVQLAIAYLLHGAKDKSVRIKDATDLLSSRFGDVDLIENANGTVTLDPRAMINAFNARHVDSAVCSVLPQQAIAPRGATRVPVS